MGEFLFSIDLEDVSNEITGKNSYTHRVPIMTHRILRFLKSTNSFATFFTTGDIARLFPSLIKEIVNEGHEIGCHSDKHLPLTALTPKLFKEDLQRNTDALRKAGADKIYGFRAPIFSLVKKTEWAYEILKELGFLYSSSVLPAKHPLFGWEEFGGDLKKTDGVFEVPLSITPFPLVRLPFSGGAYFRMFPLFILEFLFNNLKKSQKPITGYFHPQDIDVEIGKLIYKEYGAAYNFILNYNRSSVFKKIEGLTKKGYSLISYKSYIDNMKSA
ncbi:polysaccharide deacetylase family protein [bacterium]|nr:polysaccharide deacetylase family protein [bacterium]